MIRYTLACDKDHQFESWFADSAAYDKQAKRKLVSCPQCGSTKIDKTIMAPQISTSKKRAKAQSPAPAQSENAQDNSQVAMISPQEQEFRAKLKEVREHLTKNSDNVGDKFPEEARKMHYGEVEHRSIYGNASPQDAKEMLDEGIEFHPIPVLPDERN